MTDLERLKKLLDDFGVGYSVERRDLQYVLVLEAHRHAKVTGYCVFF
jgi:hypothetical protein